MFTQDEVLKMARQAGFPTDYNDKRLLHAVELEAFAKLVDAKATAREREKILRLSTKAKNIDGNCDIVLAADIRGNKA